MRDDILYILGLALYMFVMYYVAFFGSLAGLFS